MELREPRVRSIEEVRSTLELATERLHADAAQAEQLAQESIRAIGGLREAAGAPNAQLNSEHLRAECILAICLSIGGQIHDSIEKGVQLLERSEAPTDAPTRARLLNMLGVNHDILEQHDEALKYYSRCLALQRSLGDHSAISRVLGNIGVVYSRVGDESRALQHLQEAIELGQHSGAEAGRLARHTLNAAISLHRLDRNNEASDTLDVAERYARHAGHTHTLAYILVNRSDFLLKAGDQRAALATLQAAMASSTKLPNLRSMLHYKIASLLRGGDRPAAIAIAEHGLREARGHDVTESIALLHELLSEVHEEEGRYKTALHHQRSLQDIRATLLLRDQEARIANLQAIHDQEQTRRERDWLAREREAFAQSNARLVELSRERQELLSIAAHDIRTPLTLVSVVADLLAMGDHPRGEMVQHAKRLKSACTRTMAIIDNLLSARALETGQRNLKPQPIDPIPIIESVLTLLRPLAARKGIQVMTNIAVPSLLTVLADPISLGQILDNLISNAIKFTQPGGRVMVEVEASPREVQFSIHDSGPGLTQSDHQRMFQKYGRLSAKPTGDESSTGLGLYITQQLVLQLNGAIVATDNQPTGTTFQVTLPTQPDC